MTDTPTARIEAFNQQFSIIREEVGRIIVGQKEVVEGVLIALLAGGHVLLEGVPGLGKTLLIRTLADVMDLSFSRIQFTPDLMPADIVGTNIIVEDDDGTKRFEFQKGPVFGNIILADEINRATPKTQSALLEAMQERSVTVARDTYSLDLPFFVLATQNPLEMEGTYPLPEAQLDRFFFKLLIEYPSTDDLHEIMNRTTSTSVPKASKVVDGTTLLEMGALAREVPVAKHVQDFAIRVVSGTHPDAPGAPEATKRFVRYGSSPRGVQSVLLGAKVKALVEGHFNVSFDDVRSVIKPALRHRLILNFEGEAEGVSRDDVLNEIVKGTKEMAK